MMEVIAGSRAIRVPLGRCEAKDEYTSKLRPKMYPKLLPRDWDG